MAHVNLGERLFMNFDRADFVFVVENEKIPGHKVVLAETLKYFKDLLYGGFMESTSKEITISGTSAMVFKEVMRYIYLGNLEINGWTVHDLLSLLSLAHFYQFDKLVSEVVKCLQSKRLDFDSWKSIKSAASTYDLDELKSMSTAFVEEKLKEFVRFQGLEQFTAEFICFMFESPTIPTLNQEELLRAISIWKTIFGTGEIMAVFQNISWDKVSSDLINIVVKNFFSKLENADDCQFWTHVDKCIERPLECAARFDKIIFVSNKVAEFEMPTKRCSLRCSLNYGGIIELRFIKNGPCIEIPIKRIEWEFPKYYCVDKVIASPIQWHEIAMVVSETRVNCSCTKYSAELSGSTPLCVVAIFSNDFHRLRNIRLLNLVIS